MRHSRVVSASFPTVHAALPGQHLGSINRSNGAVHESAFFMPVFNTLFAKTGRPVGSPVDVGLNPSPVGLWPLQLTYPAPDARAPPKPRTA